VNPDCSTSQSGVVQSEGKFLVKGIFVLGCHFLCTTSPQDRSALTSWKLTFFIVLAHIYFYT
jgi:hypothetical protein